ncbi:MAG: protease complex subunit PrcB family protein [Gemmatimonadales bacterium]
MNSAFALLVALGSSGLIPPWGATEIGFSVQSTWTTRRTLTITDRATFRQRWSDLFAASAARPPLPVVPFATDRVIMIAAGTRPTGGYSLRLDSARVVRDSALIWLSLRTPPPGCGVTQELTAPAVAIALPRVPSAFRIITRERPDTARCDGHT